MIFNIQRFSIHDGPGIRTTVFFSGCNLWCLWCHNPESQEMKPRLEYFANSCTLCGKCAEVCPAGAITVKNAELDFNKELCGGCFTCVDYCVSEARRVSGKPMTAAEVFDIVLRDKPYYDKSGGGVTFSGGEPLLQPDFLLELLTMSHNAGIHTAVESALCAGEDIIKNIAPFVGLFMCDIKAMNDNIHKKYTGVSNKKILSNIKLLSQLSADVLIRVPVIKTVNADIGNMRLMADFLINQTKIRRVELLKFHMLAAHKYHALGINDTLTGFDNINEDETNELREILIRKGLTVL
ncbi:MAG: glycyl-radical enzyme activating protein [Eubacteriales bacterium]